MDEELFDSIKELFQCTELEAKTFMDGMLYSSKEIFRRYMAQRAASCHRIRILRDSEDSERFASFFNNLKVELVDVEEQNQIPTFPSAFEEEHLIRNWSSVSTVSFGSYTTAEHDAWERYMARIDTSSERTSNPSVDENGEHPLNGHVEGVGGLEHVQLDELGNNLEEHIFPDVPDLDAVLQDVDGMLNDHEQGQVLADGMMFPEVPVNANADSVEGQQEQQDENQRPPLAQLRRRVRNAWKIFVGGLHSSMNDTFIVSVRAKFTHHDILFDTTRRGYCLLYVLGMDTLEQVEDFMAQCRVLCVRRHPLHISLAKGKNPKAVVDFVPV